MRPSPLLANRFRLVLVPTVLRCRNQCTPSCNKRHGVLSFRVNVPPYHFLPNGGGATPSRTSPSFSLLCSPFRQVFPWHAVGASRIEQLVTRKEICKRVVQHLISSVCPGLGRGRSILMSRYCGKAGREVGIISLSR